jgi:hypothetical protein
MGTRVIIQFAKWYSRVVLTPLSYLLVIRLSQGGSWVKTLRVLPNYFKVGFTYYWHLFQSL